ncbi:MAG: diacylglycerol kinase (ATP) [Porticoccaceae bacterium]|jgi:diacylglycerol kinase (ATP)
MLLNCYLKVICTLAIQKFIFMTNDWFVIINPTSGNGKSKKQIPKLLSELNTNSISFIHVITQYHNHGFELVQKAISEGYRKFISVGGDGTLHNIVNGVMSQQIVNSFDIKIGVIPVGTGNDWIKTYGISKNIKKSVQVIKQEKTILQDVGKINLVNYKSIIYFNNLAGIGFDGYVVNSIHKYKKLGSLSYLVGVIKGFTTYKPVYLKITINNKEIITTSLMTLVGICKYSGGGMQLTKNPDSTDGFFDITIAENITMKDVLWNIRKLFNGRIVNHIKVKNFKSNHVKITVHDNSKPFIQADGELITTSNLEFQLIPKAIQFIIPV